MNPSKFRKHLGLRSRSHLRFPADASEAPILPTNDLPDDFDWRGHGAVTTDVKNQECPLDLKEAISSLCFAAPRCADLPELIQVQMAFAGKYGKEIIELFCELVVVRLPIIETQKECPLDLKEAISSLCFAAPRCADLPELIKFRWLLLVNMANNLLLLPQNSCQSVVSTARSKALKLGELREVIRVTKDAKSCATREYEQENNRT